MNNNLGPPVFWYCAGLLEDAINHRICVPAGARTVISNAAYSFLHPWSNKGNMAIRLKKLHESAQARYDKAKEWLVSAVAHQPRVPTGQRSAPLLHAPFAAVVPRCCQVGHDQARHKKFIYKHQCYRQT